MSFPRISRICSAMYFSWARRFSADFGARGSLTIFPSRYAGGGVKSDFVMARITGLPILNSFSSISLSSFLKGLLEGVR